MESMDGITVKSLRTADIQVGLLTGIKTNTTVSVGTWGNKYEHLGLWYNLEGYYSTSDTNRGSLNISLTADQLNALDYYIIYHDNWSLVINCSYFAMNYWNSVAPFSMMILPVSPIYSPINLASLIRNMPTWQ